MANPTDPEKARRPDDPNKKAKPGKPPAKPGADAEDEAFEALMSDSGVLPGATAEPVSQSEGGPASSSVNLGLPGEGVGPNTPGGESSFEWANLVGQPPSSHASEVRLDAPSDADILIREAASGAEGGSSVFQGQESVIPSSTPSTTEASRVNFGEGPPEKDPLESHSHPREETFEHRRTAEAEPHSAADTHHPASAPEAVPVLRREDTRDARPESDPIIIISRPSQIDPSDSDEAILLPDSAVRMAAAAAT